MQPGIFSSPSPFAWSLEFSYRSSPKKEFQAKELKNLLRSFEKEIRAGNVIVGLGHSLLAKFFAIRDLPIRSFPKGLSVHTKPRRFIPSTQCDLWILVRSTSRGEGLLQKEEITKACSRFFSCAQETEAFLYQEGRDLTGYEDGTENPKGLKAKKIAFIQDPKSPYVHSSFVGLQKWMHSFSAWNALSPKAQDHAMGRAKKTNQELEKAPENAHVKRTAQENFEPESFMLRRSLPYIEPQTKDKAGDMKKGLLFLSFMNDLSVFERIFARMTGEEDGIVDALFQFTFPETGSFYWCPALSPKGTLLLPKNATSKKV